MNRSATLPMLSPIAASLLATNASAGLVGINYSDGSVYSISTTDASATHIGTAQRGVMGVDRANDGTIYAITDGIAGAFGTLDQSTWAFTSIGRLSAGFTSEGALAIDADGRAFGGVALAGGGRGLFEIDMLTGQASPTVPLTAASSDINGMTFRSDGALVAIDRVSNQLVSIDPLTGALTGIAQLQSPGIGAVGGLTVDNGVGYYATAGAVSGSEGDNSLYRIDLFTGEQSLIGELGPDAGAGFGIGALVSVPVPAPASLGVFATLGFIGIRRRR